MAEAYYLSVSTGTVSHASETRGVFDPSRTNFFCGSCRSFVQAPAGAAAMRECPTRDCTRATGFGPFAKTPRPRTSERR
jgi:LSD1 subclass zinc finger protein